MRLLSCLIVLCWTCAAMLSTTCDQIPTTAAAIVLLRRYSVLDGRSCCLAVDPEVAWWQPQLTFVFERGSCCLTVDLEIAKVAAPAHACGALGRRWSDRPEGQRQLNDCVGSLRRRHVEFQHRACHDLVDVLAAPPVPGIVPAVYVCGHCSGMQI